MYIYVQLQAAEVQFVARGVRGICQAGDGTQPKLRRKHQPEDDDYRHPEFDWWVLFRGSSIFRCRTVCRKKKHNLTETNIFSYGGLSYGEKSMHSFHKPKDDDYRLPEPDWWLLFINPKIYNGIIHNLYDQAV